MNRSGPPPNEFEAGKAGTAERDSAEASIEELRQRGGMFVNAVRATRMPMALTDPNLPGNPIVFANQAFLKLSGYSMAEVLGQQPYFMNGYKTDPQDKARFAEALRSEQDDIIETVQYRKDGSIFVATVLLSAFKDDEGRTLNHFMSWLDVTRRVNAESEVADLRLAGDKLSDDLFHTNLLWELSTRSVSEDNIQTIHEGILLAAIEIMKAKAGTVQVLDPESKKLAIITARGIGEEAMEYFREVDASSGTSCGLALQTGNRAYFDFDPASTDKSSTLHVRDGILSAQSTPLLSRSGKPIGMVSTHWEEPGHRASVTEHRFLDMLARQAADLLEQRATARALSEREQRSQTLLAELQHRVRNTLAVIRSIVRRTASGSDSVQQFEEHLDGRLSSFARTQAYVTRDPTGSVDLELIIRDEIVAHAARSGHGLSIKGPEVRLTAKQAETMSLAIHELASNAIKHGALRDDGNRIDVSWSLEGQGENRTLHFSWREKLAGRTLEKAGRAGFGTELLERVLCYELDATPVIEFKPDGLNYRVRIPLPQKPASH